MFRVFWSSLEYSSITEYSEYFGVVCSIMEYSGVVWSISEYSSTMEFSRVVWSIQSILEYLRIV